MTYEEAREQISARSPRGIQPGLTNITQLCKLLGNPQNALNIIHIAGTNGKGSTGAFLASILNAAGLSIGRFTSPAVGDYLEGFTIDEKNVSESIYTECAEKVLYAIEQLESEGIFPTSFESETAIAFLIFQKLSPDYVLLECGMGGRLDSTNVITMPYASVITSVSVDHTKFLGSTLREIAAEKSGIIKDNCPVITCSQNDEVMEVIADLAMMHDSPLYIADDIEDVSFFENKTNFSFENEEYTIHLQGSFQPINAAIAIKAAQILGISRARIKQGLSNAVYEYRFERIGRYILDGAHNEGAARELAKSMELYLKDKNTAFICGCFKDKDYQAAARLTAPYADTIFCVKPPTDRGLKPETLRDTFLKYTKDVRCASDLSEAIAAADAYDAVVIFGSLSILGEAKRIINGRINANAKMQ